MSSIFKECRSLQSLPDISKWDTKNVTKMNSMFSNCTSLKSLPDISKWDITNMINMFNGCSSLKSLPDISRWDTKNIAKKDGIFYVHINLQLLTGISKLDNKKYTRKNDELNKYNKSKVFPDTPERHTKIITDACGNDELNKCRNIKLIHHKSKQDTRSVNEHKKLKLFSDTFKWDSRNITRKDTKFGRSKSILSKKSKFK